MLLTVIFQIHADFTKYSRRPPNRRPSFDTHPCPFRIDWQRLVDESRHKVEEEDDIEDDREKL